MYFSQGTQIFSAGPVSTKTFKLLTLELHIQKELISW